MMLLTCCTCYASKFGKLSSGFRTGKVQFSFQSQERQCQKCSHHYTIAHISHATTEIMLKILQARLQQYMNQELTDVLARFRKGRGVRDQIANTCWIIEKARKFQKNIYFCFIDKVKTFDYVNYNKLWNILNEMGIPDYLTCLQRNLYARQEAKVRSEHGMTNWFQTGKEYIKAAYCHPTYLTYMQSTSCECWTG